MNIAALERRIGRTLPASGRAALEQQQHQAARWTFLGSGMAHPQFRASLTRLSPSLTQQLDAIAPHFS
jgi:hypothetical protein